MKQDGKSRRKLSKRRDPEATVSYYFAEGFPSQAVEYYLRGLANGRLAEMPLPEALATPIALPDFGVAGPLVDLVKLDDISADYVAGLSGDEIYSRVCGWALTYDDSLVEVLNAERELALRALDIERVGVENPRKDLRKWSDFRRVYGYFFPEIFDVLTDPSDARFAGLPEELVRAIAAGFADSYVSPGHDVDWFGQIRELTTRLGFAASNKEYKADPEKYPGSLKEVSPVIRVLLTGSTRSPDLAQVASALGTDEVLRRVHAVL
jgi:glutamyl-tRNA synthetase